MILRSSAPSQDGGMRRVLVVGEESAIGVADYLTDHHEVVLLSTEQTVVQTATMRDMQAHRTDIRDGGQLRGHAEWADAAVVATDRDRANLLVARLLRGVESIEEIVVQVNDPQYDDVFDDDDIGVVIRSTVVGPEIGAALSRQDE